MPYHGLLASQASRLEALKSRHAALSHRIEQEQQRAASDDIGVTRLKRQKLYLKDMIQELEDTDAVASA